MIPIAPPHYRLFAAIGAVVLGTATAHAVEFNEQTLAALKSPSPAERQKFYRMLPQLPDLQKPAAVAQLQEARAYHKGRVLESFAAAARGDSAWGRFVKAHTAWREAVATLLTNIRTDWHKDPKKVADLTREIGQCARLRDHVRQAATAAQQTDYARMLAATGVLLELDRVVAFVEGNAGTFQQTPAETLALAVAGSETEAQLKTLAAWPATLKRYAEADEANAKCRWAKEEQRRFAAILNEARSTVDLTPLRLDEQLSAAAVGHSKEMVAKGYFAHESPVPENKSFVERARNAKFDGGPSGECIFMGDRSPTAAYGGWWGSDGHRFIMFGEANTLGVGHGGTDHWTLNTGNKKWP
ncbi:MAG: CAP domain-containing protein [Chthoniobacter sp.]|nr:CAP domain-containing protein [Chthoniobacter sp.]